MSKKPPKKKSVPKPQPVNTVKEKVKKKVTIQDPSDFDNDSNNDHKFRVNDHHQIGIGYVMNKFQSTNIIKFRMMLPKRRRLGIKRLNTNMKLLFDEKVLNNHDDSDAESNHIDNNGHFTAHGREYTFDKHSLFIFSSEWKIRKIIVWIIVWSWFDYFILSCILANSINLAMFDYSKDDTGNSKTNSNRSYNDYLELIFTFIF